MNLIIDPTGRIHIGEDSGIKPAVLKFQPEIVSGGMRLTYSPRPAETAAGPTKIKIDPEKLKKQSIDIAQADIEKPAN